MHGRLQCGKQGRTWRPVQEDAGAPAQALREEVGVAQRQLDRLQDGRLHVLQAAHVLPLHVGHLQRICNAHQPPANLNLKNNVCIGSFAILERLLVHT